MSEQLARDRAAARSRAGSEGAGAAAAVAVNPGAANGAAAFVAPAAAGGAAAPAHILGAGAAAAVPVGPGAADGAAALAAPAAADGAASAAEQPALRDEFLADAVDDGEDDNDEPASDECSTRRRASQPELGCQRFVPSTENSFLLWSWSASTPV